MFRCAICCDDLLHLTKTKCTASHTPDLVTTTRTLSSMDSGHARLISEEESFNLYQQGDDEGDEIKLAEEEDDEYPPLSHYLPFFLLLNMSALSFGTTISFTGPNIDAMINDLSLCGRVVTKNKRPMRDKAIRAKMCLLLLLDFFVVGLPLW